MHFSEHGSGNSPHQETSKIFSMHSGFMLALYTRRASSTYLRKKCAKSPFLTSKCAVRVYLSIYFILEQL